MKIEEYFKGIERKVRICYDVAEAARAKGLDPRSFVEIPLARNLAERVAGLLSIKYPQLKDEKIVNRIKELEREYGLLDHAVAFKIAEEIAKEKFCKFRGLLEAIDAGLRVAFGYLTVGVVAAPLEGYTHFKLKKTRKGEDYFALYFSGPIGAAGRTIASIFLVIADYLRETFGFAKYDPTEDEIKRAVIEIYDRHERVTNLQYLPSKEEIEFLYRRLPIQLDGDPTESKEVSNYKDLDRIETNNIRSGFCLILGEGISQKASKLIPILIRLKKKGFNLDGWDFLEEFVELQKKIQQEKKETSASAVYIQDIVAGRPVLGHPSRQGGFRLRYGRSRFSGLSSMAISPYTMAVLNGFIAIGTQLKYEGPGKSSAMTPCDSIEGPIVKLNNSGVIKIDNDDKLRKAKEKGIKEILHLGDFLVNYGEYFNRGKRLQKPGYCCEWYSAELEQKEVSGVAEEIVKNPWKKISLEEAFDISKKYSVPLHPDFIYYWSHLDKELFLGLIDWIMHSRISENKLLLPWNKTEQERFKQGKRALELLGAEHEVVTENIMIDEENTKALLFNLGIGIEGSIEEKISLNIEKIKNEEDVLIIVNKLCMLKIKDKAGTYIGARMGRPEKAKLRKLIGSPNVLFPVGDEGGRLRSINEAVKTGTIKADFPIYFCKNCQKETIYYICEDCGNYCDKMNFCPECRQKFFQEKCPEHVLGLNFMTKRIDAKHYFDNAIKKADLLPDEVPKLIKGVRGTSNKQHIPETLTKGILRAVYNLQVNKDGTIRYDITEQALTHFKPKEIMMDVESLRELGYKKDMYGKELENEEQIVELLPLDIILPSCQESANEKADDVLINISKFIDHLLIKLYGLKSFYNIQKKEDLIGQLVVGLAPHTSAGVIGRVIGFSKTQGCIANPLWHAAMRRDCEGDETCVMLLLDALINFSREYLPAHRGATQDAPLVITVGLNPAEVDDMIFDMDVVWKYPLKLYDAAEKELNPWDIKIEQIKDRLGTEKQYYDFGFTHNIGDINNAVRYSAYKSLPNMMEKLDGQMKIAELIRAVDTSDVARLIIDRHFIRDIRGNLRKFSQQVFRCSKCNEKYRRPPLTGKCEKCGGNIIFTISEGGIIKYLEPAIQLAEKYDVPSYIKQSLELTKNYIESIFGKEKEKQEALKKWCG